MGHSGFRPLIFLVSLPVLLACHLTQSGKEEPVFDFPTLKSTIGDADHATIVLKDSTGKLIDTLYHAAVTPSTTFRGLAAPGYDGGKATLFIEATKNGVVVYKVERGYDGKAGGNQGPSTILVSPGTTLEIEWILPRVREGDSTALPSVKIQPSNLSEKSLAWVSRQPHLLAVTPTHLKGIAPGSAILVCILQSDTTKKDSLAVEVVPRSPSTTIPTSLSLSPDPLKLALRGPTGRFNILITPPTASQEVLWTSLDLSTVGVSEEGTLTPLAEGLARIVATSTADPTVLDTAKAQVVAPLQVDSIRLHKDSLELFANGTPEEILATVHPDLANPRFFVLSRDPTMVRVDGALVQGLKEGEVYVQVRSVEDESKTDSLKVIVFPSQQVDSVKVTPDTLRLYVNGEHSNLNATIHPSSLLGRFTWRSSDVKVATVDGAGRVSPSGEGRTYVSARARADGTRSDSSLIMVKKDTPRLRVGADTVISAGTTLIFRPEAPQEYGRVALFKWDLTGDGIYEDSANILQAVLTQHYAEVKEYGARFYVRDSEGNDTVVVRKVKAVNGRVVQITSPKDGAYVNTTPIMVTWTVDGNTQSSGQPLNLGANIITRSAQDSAAMAFSHSITVHLDQTAPKRPIVQGPTMPVNTLTPEWRWSSGGGGGNGIFRYRIGDPDLSAQPSLPDTFFTAPSNLSGGTHTLYVQERDEAGNWSANGSFALRIDTTAPPAPTVSVSPSSPTNTPRPTWTWTGGSGDTYRYYRYKLNNDDFRSGARDTTGTSFTPTANLSDTVHTLYVQARDSAGNWSATASRNITIDTRRPTAPTLSVGPAALTNDETPTWSWAAVPGASGYRFKMNDANLEAGATETSQLSHTPATGLGEGTFTLYVQARDAAGNWSPGASRQVRIDLTPPTAPRIDSTPYSPLNSLRPRWTWRSGTGGAKVFRARVDNPDLNGQPEQQDSSFSPAANLHEGLRTYYIQERDSAGNWSPTTSKSLFLALRDTLGSPGFSIGSATAPKVAVGSNGIVYAAFIDGIYSSPFVKRFDASTDSWIDAGSGLTIGTASPYFAFALDPNDVPYIVYNGYLVMKLIGTAWQFVGDTLQNRERINGEHHVLDFDKEGNPFLAYNDANESWNISVSRFDGLAWKSINRNTLSNASRFLDLEIGVDDRPYLAFWDASESKSYVVSVNPYAGAMEWDTLGGGPAESENIYGLKLKCFDSKIILGTTDSEKSRILAFENSNWVVKHSQAWEVFGIEADTQGRIHLAFKNNTGTPQFAVKKEENSNWISVGAPLVTAGGGEPALALSPEGMVYIGFRDVGKGDRPTVIRTSFDP